MPLAQVILIHSTNPTTKVMEILEQLKQLAPLAGAATEGPWHIVEDNDGVVASYLLTPQADSYIDPDGNFYNDFANISNPSNAAFMVAARALLTSENLTLIIGLLSNMESSFETNRVLCARLLAIQSIVMDAPRNTAELDQIYCILNPSKIAKR